ncbi:hypothetical protein CLAIMM_02878 [Cladophialophora immunda]|nr:hypothetical protein CLAIMM_02878 [Cladophialophora immunda]
MNSQRQTDAQPDERIRSCYQNDPEAFSYYEELVDYIEKGLKKDLGSSEDKPRLAQWWNLRPEFFTGHIFGSIQNHQRGFYSLPTLPSRQENVIRIHFVSLVKSLVERPGLTSFLEKRSEVEEACRQYEKHLFTGNRFGVTRFREISQHDACYCSVEQIISFTVAANRSPWVAVYLTDQGTSLLDGIRLPWTDYHSGATTLNSGTPIGTVPIVPYNAPITSEPFHRRLAARQSSREGSPSPLPSPDNKTSINGPSFSQLHPLRNIVVHDETDMQLLSEDPFFLIASLFTTSALSFVQLLNYLPRDLPRVEFALAENLRWIAQGGCSTWPRAQPGTDTMVRKEALQTTLRTDHEALQQRCVIMRRDCESATMFLVSYSQLQCAERSTAQASEIQRLTKLALFFVPLAFVTSAFGMNVKELQQHFPSIWVFSATAVVISVATYSAMFWSEVWHWSSSTWRKLRARAKRDLKRRWTEA